MLYVFGLILVTISIYEHANTLSFYHMDQITLSDKCLNIIVDTKVSCTIFLWQNFAILKNIYFVRFFFPKNSKIKRNSKTSSCFCTSFKQVATI